MMKWVSLSWSQCQVGEVEEEEPICNWSWFDVSRAVWLGGQGGGGGAIWKTKQFDHFWLGGRGGGEEEVVKNQAVISISYQVWENFLGYFPIA